jgi:transposase
MDELPPAPEGIPPDEWATWPLMARVLITMQQQQIVSLTAQVAALTARVQELEQRLNQTSQNSGKPPSSDPPSAPPRPQKPPHGRQRGGQPGHPGNTRERREPDTITALHPTCCPTCQAALAPTLPDVCPPRVLQSWNLPRIRPIITDFVQHTVACPVCATPVTAELPPEAQTGYGAEVMAAIAHLHGTYHLSYRAVGALLADLADLPIGVGSVVACTQRVSDALAPLATAIQTAIHTTAVVNVDETSWRESGRRAWLWVASSPQCTSFRITTSRGRAGLDVLLPADYGGIVGSDRWNAYNRYPAPQRQLCWAHLTRNVRALAEARMPESAWATGLLDQIDALFAAWYAFRNGTTDRAGLQQAIQPIQQAIRTALDTGRAARWYKISGLSQELLTWWEALWTFVTHPGVEPTNNAAERALRPAVIWRKQCFGTQSDAGSRFVEWILSVVTTCRQQGRNVWEVLTAAVRAAWAGQPAPSLLPTT